MEKSENAFRTIGEMSKQLGVKTHILRYWEEQFPTLNPLKRAGGRRHYRREDVELLKTINRLLNEEGYTIKGARKHLSGGGKSNQAKAYLNEVESEAARSSSAFDFGKLRDIRNRLVTALQSA